MDKYENIIKLKKLTGVSSEICEKVYDDCEGDMDAAIAELLDIKKGKKRNPKEKKMFKIGDSIKCIDDKPGKLTPDCIDFLMTYKKFKVLDVNDKWNIHIGHISVTGKPYYFSPNRFELIEGKAPVFKPEPTDKRYRKI
jgi:hypothetical protein